MILVLSFFILIILFLVFGLFFSKVKINIKKFYFVMSPNETHKNEYLINIGIYLFGKIKIFGINLSNDAIKLMGKKISYQKIKNTKFYKEIVKPDADDLDKKELLDYMKNLYIKFEKFNLNLTLGTDSTLITSFLIFAVSTIISFILKKGISKYNAKKHSFIITPKYENYNLINANLNCIIAFKTSKMIKILIYLNKIARTKDKMKKDTLLDKKKHSPGYV